MITQCPHCQKQQNVPELYRGKEIKCLECKEAFTAFEYHEPESVKINSARMKHFEAAGNHFFNAIGQVAAMLFGGIICSSIVICGLGGIFEPNLGAIQYLLGVIAFCAVLRVIKK